MKTKKKEPTKKESIKKKLSNVFDIPKEVILNVPIVSQIGSEELTIENYKGLIEYGDQKIRILTASGVILVEGNNIILKYVTSEAIFLKGNILKTEFIK